MSDLSPEGESWFRDHPAVALGQHGGISVHAMTVDEGVAEIVELMQTGPGEDVPRTELRRILKGVRSAGYAKGTTDQYE